MKICFLLTLSLFSLSFAQAQSQAPAQTPAPMLTGLRRVYSDNSAWSIGTAAAPAGISLKNLYADGSEWLVSAAGKTYHLKRTYHDDSEWQVAETGTVLRRAYSGDNTEWRVQRGRAGVSLRDRFKDGAQWDGEGFSLTRKFADNSAWTITDQARTQPLDVKLLLVFAALHSAISRP